jgi:hypothetical protein
MSPTEGGSAEPPNDDIEFWDGRTSLNKLTSAQIRDDYGRFAHLIIRLQDQIPVGGIHSDNRQALMRAFEKKNGPGHLDEYMVRLGPRVIVEEADRSFSDRISSDPPAPRDR